MKIIDARKKDSDEDFDSRMITGSILNDEEDEARRQYEESATKMKQASERIRRIKIEKEERFKMKLE